MKKLFLTVVALLGATTLFAQTDIVATFQQGAANAKSGNLEEAIEQLNTVIDEYYNLDEPDANQEKAFAMAKSYIVKCYNMLGGRAYNAKDYDTAVEYFTSAADNAELFDNIAEANKNRQFVGKCYEAKGATAFNDGDYATAIEVFSKGYAADKRNTAMALNLAESYFKSDMYQEGMKICSEIAALNADKFGEAIAEANAKMNMYTNNEVAKLQMANDYDGIIAMAEQLPDAAMAQKVIMQAYYGKKDFAKMIEHAAVALEAQTTDEGRSDINYLLGVAYNEKEMFDQAIAAMKKVTAGNNVANAQAVITALTTPAK
ncbi:MAG: tetratricopeptide repeat protein [Alistipes sp.]|jgi:tetratricopeptide (TPR) repeat protein|nr:tetratricopeptide repeat protein [Alistipes sp.]